MKLNSEISLDRLAWDTEFFGFDIGAATLKRSVNERSLEAMFRSSVFDLIYLFSPKPLSFTQSVFTSEKCIYSKELSRKAVDENISIFDFNKHSYNELLQLVFLSGIYSRFALDHNFGLDSFKKLYTTWIDKCISGQIKSKVFVYQETEMGGFVTLEYPEGKTPKIGLIAVQKSFQGKGIGSKLIRQCEYELYEQGFEYMTVATQGINEIAKSVYEEYGFHLEGKEHIYHLWKK